MDIRLYQNRERMLVQLSGRVVLDECDRLKGAIVPRISPPVSQVILDLARVEFIDSAGLGALVGMKVSSNKNRARLCLAAPSKSVSEILLVSKLDSIFDVLKGAEAQSAIGELARNEYLISTDESGPGATEERAAPQFQAPPTQSAAARTPSAAVDHTPAGTPKEQIEHYCRKAVEFMRTREYDLAAECYKRALQLDEDHLPAHNNLAIVYEKKPQWHPLAIKQWEKVLELSQARGDQKHIERALKHLDALT
jgi:anti-sigma B factor antagonist